MVKASWTYRTLLVDPKATKYTVKNRKNKRINTILKAKFLYNVYYDTLGFSTLVVIINK